MHLTEEQVAHYYREGYLLVRQLAPLCAVEAVMQEARTRVREGDRWQPSIFKHDDPSNDAQIHQLLWQQSVHETATQLLGTPARIYYGMLAIVPPKGGHGLPWHQDNQYSTILGGALNIFIALAPVTREMANLWVAPRSHIAGVQPSRPNETTAPGHREALTEPENVQPLPDLNPGDACVFDRNTLHRSLRNTTDKPRFAYAAQYMADHARMAETGRRDELRMPATALAYRFPKLIRHDTETAADMRMHI